MAEINTIGIIGAGQMGNGIAHVAALAGYDVLLSDVSADQLAAALGSIQRNLTRQAGRGLIKDDEIATAMGRIKTTADIGDLSNVDLAIEAASEKEDIKRAIFKSLCAVVRPDTILASNTSSLSITRLASSTDRPERFIGLHFMNPVPMMKLVEVIRGLATNEETYQAATNVALKMGKTITNAEDFPAFIVNRVLIPMINEAVYTLYEGVGTVEGIDKAMRLGANHPMGPLELADFVGLDTILSIMQVLNEGLADTKYRPCPLLVKYVEAGWLGRKTQRGFYDYRGDVPVPTR
jgi:3-hydroxybutyryl-CoA dehydrogenase